jgi:hypothetical protein
LLADSKRSQAGSTERSNGLISEGLNTSRPLDSSSSSSRGGVGVGDKFGEDFLKLSSPTCLRAGETKEVEEEHPFFTSKNLQIKFIKSTISLLLYKQEQDFTIVQLITQFKEQQMVKQ